MSRSATEAMLLEGGGRKSPVVRNCVAPANRTSGWKVGASRLRPGAGRCSLSVRLHETRAIYVGLPYIAAW